MRTGLENRALTCRPLAAVESRAWAKQCWLESRHLTSQRLLQSQQAWVIQRSCWHSHSEVQVLGWGQRLGLSLFQEDWCVDLNQEHFISPKLFRLAGLQNRLMPLSGPEENSGRNLAIEKCVYVILKSSSTQANQRENACSWTGTRTWYQKQSKRPKVPWSFNVKGVT